MQYWGWRALIFNHELGLERANSVRLRVNSVKPVQNVNKSVRIMFTSITNPNPNFQPLKPSMKGRKYMYFLSDTSRDLPTASSAL